MTPSARRSAARSGQLAAAGRLSDTGRSTVWAPAVLHPAIDPFKLVVAPDAGPTTSSLLLAGTATAPNLHLQS